MEQRVSTLMTLRAWEASGSKSQFVYVQCNHTKSNVTTSLSSPSKATPISF